MSKLVSAYLLKDITEYGKLMAYCIEHDICVWRTYWDEREAGERCYCINWQEKSCRYSKDFYKKRCSLFWERDVKYQIVRPVFSVDQYGVVTLEDGEVLDL